MHGEALVMIGGEREHLHPLFFEELHPLISVESRWIPGFVVLLILLFLGRRQSQEWPARVPPLLE